MMVSRRNPMSLTHTHGLISVGIATCLLLSVWVLITTLRGEDVLLAEKAQAISPSTPVSARFAATLTTFLPLVLSDHSSGPTIFGAQMYGSLHSPASGLSLTQQAQVYWVRWPLSWSAVEPVNTVPEGYNFSPYDSSILSATQAGLHLIVTVVSNPGWAAYYANGPIDKVDIGAFTEFVGTLVERYDGDGWQDAPGSPVVDYLEFYNEPDAGDELYARYGASYWGHFGAEYAQMLCAVYPVVKAANPRARVVIGGLAYDNFEPEGNFVREFLDDVLVAGGGQCFDVMNYHYYPVFEGVWAPYGPGLGGKASYLYDKLRQYGLEGKPMIVTEAGWHSDDYPTFPSTPEIQSRYVVKLFTQSVASHLDVMIWWTWIDPGGYYGANGLLTQDLECKPAYYAYQTAVQELGQASFQRMLSFSELGSTALEGYRLIAQETRPLYVLWSNDATTRPVALPLPRAKVTGMYGETVAFLDDGEDGQVDGRVRVMVGPNPTYVEAVP